MKTQWRRRRVTDEGGYVLLLVLVISLIALSLAGVAIQSSLNNQVNTSSYGNTIQSRLNSESGINAAVSLISNATSVSSICTPPTGANFTVTFRYTPATACSGSTWPTSVLITSTGTATNGAPVHLTEQASITAPVSNTTTLNPAFNYAVLTPGKLGTDSGATIKTGASGVPADVSVGNGNYCTNNNVISGTVYSYSTTAISYDSNCSIGALYSASGVTLTNTVNVTGNVTSYGNGGISLTSTPTIGGNVTTTNGVINMTNSPTIKGNAYAYGAINYNSSPVTATYGTGYIKGIANQNYTGYASQTMASQWPEPAFPTITDASQAQWAAAGYTNYVVVTNSGVTVNGVADTSGANGASNTCSTYFATTYLPVNNYGAGLSPFNLLANSATTPTVVDASACTNPSFNGPGNVVNVALKADMVLLVNGLSTQGSSNSFTSSNSTSHNFSIIVPSPETGNITLTSNSVFSSTLNTLLYTAGTVTLNTTSSLNGQILAGSVTNNSVYMTNNTALTFSNAAASTIPGTTVTVQGAGNGAPTVTVIRRYSSS
jgi:hypothetical protein